ncbi:MAG: hypothetical protein M3P30_16710 [Chloroflexota bacterium]|nr:hypothetical protein [Chloroflexota bacterium]
MLDETDDLHDLAQAVLDELYTEGDVEFATSDFVLAELLTFFARQGERQRALAVELAQRVLAERGVTCVPGSRDLWLRSMQHYASRLDKLYSFTDCSSMVICGELEIRDVLSHDHDFEQEGLTIRM